jgi:hypothetical protein
MTLALATSVGFLLLAGGPPTQDQKCQPGPPQTVSEETYQGLSDRTYLYVPKIESAGAAGTWKPFTIRVLVGTFRRPFLLPKAFMNEADLQKLLAGRPDIKQTPVKVPGSDPKGAGTSPLNVSVTVNDGNTPGKLTIRVSRVNASAYSSSVVFEVCVTKG